MKNNDAVNRAAVGFAAHFGRAPQWIASAPGRVNLIGEFTDYNDGFVLPMALHYRTVVAAAPSDADRITLKSESAKEPVTVGLHEPLAPEPVGRWGNYVRGVLAGFVALGVERRGFDALITSDLPMGAGLSSSAALEVAFATLLEGVSGLKLEPVVKALLCQTAEHTFAKVPCGIMDLFISTMGQRDHALLLDCRSLEPVWLPVADPAVTVLVVNTNVRHQLSLSAYSDRREECRAAAAVLEVESLREASPERLSEHADRMDPIVVRRARHVISENARTLQASYCIREGDWRELGQLMDASHLSLKNDYEVSCVELDTVVSIAQQIGPRGGILGCRMTGGGFGGCAIALIQTPRRDEIIRTVESQYRARIGIAPTLFTFRPGHGAELVER